MDDAAHDSSLIEAKKLEWAAMQKDLAQRVRVPRTERYEEEGKSGAGKLSQPVVSGAVDTSFCYDRFCLPTEELSSLIEAYRREKEKGGETLGTSVLTFLEQIEWDLYRQQSSLQTDSPTSTIPLAPPALPPPLTRIAGLDISFVPSSNRGVACLAIFEYPSLTPVKTIMHHCVLKEPYISGFLAFREVQPVMELFALARPELEASGDLPQLIYVDGCGVYHPRRCGLASHLGVLLDIPTIGCAKNILCVDGISRETVEAGFHYQQQQQQQREVTSKEAVACHPSTSSNHDGLLKREKKKMMKKGTAAAWLYVRPLLPLVGLRESESDSYDCAPKDPPLSPLYGYALLTGNSVKKCIFVSPGHCIGFAVAAAMVLLVCKHRIPEPIRAADLGSRELIRKEME